MELEDSLKEESVSDEKNASHVEDHEDEVNISVHSLDAPEIDSASSVLAAWSLGNDEEDTAETSRIATWHTKSDDGYCDQTIDLSVSSYQPEAVETRETML